MAYFDCFTFVANMGLDGRAKDHGVGGDSIMCGMGLYASRPYGSILDLEKTLPGPVYRV